MNSEPAEANEKDAAIGVTVGQAPGEIAAKHMRWKYQYYSYAAQTIQAV
jgi:hypothetical protein